MSTRNMYLTSGQRESARCFYQALKVFLQLADIGKMDADTIIRPAVVRISAHPDNEE